MSVSEQPFLAAVASAAPPSASESPDISLDMCHAGERASISRFETAVTAFEVLSDLMAVLLGVAFAYLAYRGLHLGKRAQYESVHYLVAVLGFAIFFVLMLDRGGAYRRGNSLLRVKETERVLRTTLLCLLIVIPISFFGQVFFSRWLFLIGAGSVPLVVITEKHLLYLAVRALHLRGYGVQRVVIYGAGDTGRRVFSALVRSPKLGLHPVALVDDDEQKAGMTVFELSYERRRSAPVMQGPLTRKLVERCDASQVLIAIPSLSANRFLKAVSEAVSANARVSFVPSQFLPGDASVEHTDIDGLLLSSLGRMPARPVYEFLKRIIDCTLAAGLLLVLSPLFLVVAILIRRNSRGPVFFVQKRAGRNGVLFDLYKFRTLYVDTPAYYYSPKDTEDPRITPIGRFLRRTSLDELPQLLNVIRGDMSLVGPRPEMPFIVETYSGRQRQRLEVKPGLTGLWQLSADRAYLIHENLAYDMYYIKNRGLFMDLSILIHTLFFAMRGT